MCVEAAFQALSSTSGSVLHGATVGLGAGFDGSLAFVVPMNEDVFMPDFEVDLAFSYRVQPVNVVTQVVRDALEPIATEAGKRLIVNTMREPRGAENVPEIIFIYERFQTGPGGDSGIQAGASFIPSANWILGNEGGTVWVNKILELRVGGGPQFGRNISFSPYSSEPRIDYVSQTATVFVEGEVEYARCAGNVAVHELAHQFGITTHSTDPSNFMAQGSSLGPLYLSLRREQLRQFWAGAKQFDDAQIATIRETIRRGVLPGGVVLESAPSAAH